MELFERVFLLYLLAFVAALSSAAASGSTDSVNVTKKPCPDGFNYTLDGLPKCYAVVNNKLNWTEAQTKCRQLHGKAHLAIIGSALEDQFVMEILQNHNCWQSILYPNGDRNPQNQLWIGGSRQNISDCGTPFVWKLPAGGYLKLSYENWKEGQPDCHQGIEKCLGIWKVNDQQWQWNDLPCYGKLCPICEVMKFA